MNDWRYWAVVFGIVVVVAVACVPISRWIFQQRLDESGWSEWTAIAATLPRRDRWTLYWATMRGRRPRDPRLTGLAVQRGAITARHLHSMEAVRSRMLRWVPVVWVFVAVVTFLDGHVVMSALCVLCLGLGVLMPRWKAFNIRMAERSARGGS